MATICNLIIKRQHELWDRVVALQRVCQEDGGAIAEDAQLGAMVDEMHFLMELGRARLEELEAAVQQ